MAMRECTSICRGRKLERRMVLQIQQDPTFGDIYSALIGLNVTRDVWSFVSGGSCCQDCSWRSIRSQMCILPLDSVRIEVSFSRKSAIAIDKQCKDDGHNEQQLLIVCTC